MKALVLAVAAMLVSTAAAAQAPKSVQHDEEFTLPSGMSAHQSPVCRGSITYAQCYTTGEGSTSGYRFKGAGGGVVAVCEFFARGEQTGKMEVTCQQ